MLKHEETKIKNIAAVYEYGQITFPDANHSIDRLQALHAEPLRTARQGGFACLFAVAIQLEIPTEQADTSYERPPSLSF